MADQAAKKGRIDSYYSFKSVNDEGMATIEASVIVRDQSFESASSALLNGLSGISQPAKDQITST